MENLTAGNPTVILRSGERQLNAVRIWLSGGLSVTVQAVKLFPEDLVAQATALSLKARDLLKPKPSGLGYLGSFSWVLTASLVDGGIMSLVNDKLAGEGTKVLSAFHEARARMREQGIFFPMESIEGSDVPEPSAWRAGRECRSVRVVHSPAKTAWYEVQQFEESTVLVDDVKRYVFDGDRFVNVATTSGSMLLLWEQVVAYQVVDSSRVCPFCTEAIQSEATVCQHCSRALPPPPPVSEVIKS